jgi:hypothetical protein
MNQNVPLCAPRVNDRGQTWRIVYRIDFDAIVILDVFAKKTGRTPARVIDICQSCRMGFSPCGLSCIKPETPR